MATRKVTGVILAALVMLSASCAMATVTLASLPEFRKTWKFNITGGAKADLKTALNNHVVCGSSSGKGEVGQVETKVAKGIKIVLKECKLLTEHCTTTGLAAGEIELTPEGELGYLEPGVVGAETVALALSHSTKWGEFICGAITIKMEGCAVGALTKAGVETEEYKLKFEETGGVQKFLGYEPEKGKAKVCKPKVMFGAFPEEAGIEMTDTLKSATAGEKEEVRS